MRTYKRSKQSLILAFLVSGLCFTLLYILFLKSISFNSFINSILELLQKAFPEILGSFVAVFLTIVFIELVIPYIRNKQLTAQHKLDEFYTIAYSFIQIRKDFEAIEPSGIKHNKSNCGFFHSFNETQVGSTNTLSKTNSILFDEYYFLDFTSKNLSIMSEKLRELFIEYFNRRFVQAMHVKSYSCNDSKLIRLRMEIEETIISDYEIIKNQL